MSVTRTSRRSDCSDSLSTKLPAGSIRLHHNRPCKTGRPLIRRRRPPVAFLVGGTCVTCGGPGRSGIAMRAVRGGCQCPRNRRRNHPKAGSPDHSGKHQTAQQNRNGVRQSVQQNHRQGDGKPTGRRLPEIRIIQPGRRNSGRSLSGGSLDPQRVVQRNHSQTMIAELGSHNRSMTTFGGAGKSRAVPKILRRCGSASRSTMCFTCC